MRLMVEVQRLLTANVESPGESDPTNDQGKSESEPKDKQISPHDYSFGTQFLLEKKCWSKHTNC
jgi:hypothetical protein